MSRTIEAKSASAAMDAIEAEIDDRPPTAKAYGVGVDDVITITISAFSEDGLDRASRTLHYPAA
jgi:hypothetical protein